LPRSITSNLKRASRNITFLVKATPKTSRQVLWTKNNLQLRRYQTARVKSITASPKYTLRSITPPLIYPQAKISPTAIFPIKAGALRQKTHLFWASGLKKAKILSTATANYSRVPNRKRLRGKVFEETSRRK
jgi:hypothetical protein